MKFGPIALLIISVQLTKHQFDANMIHAGNVVPTMVPVSGSRMADQRYTLSLPPEIYEELRCHAERNGTTIREVVRQVLKFGLVAMKISEKEDSEIIFREKVSGSESDDPV